MKNQVMAMTRRGLRDAKSLELKNLQFAHSTLFYFSDPERPKLSPKGFMVWSALLSRAVPIVGITSVSITEIRKMTGIGSNDTVSKSIKELCDKGYLSVLDIGGPHCHPLVYKLERFVKKEYSEDGEDIGAMILDVILKAEQERRAKA